MRVTHVEIMGRDAAALRSYYGELFGWTYDIDDEIGYGLVRDAGEPSIGVFGGMEGYDGHVTCYVNVPDVEAALVRAEELGGKRVMGPEKVPGGFTVGQFTDPEGHLVGVITS